jgi:hypothetical protein
VTSDLKQIPPVVAYGTFDNFLHRMKQGVPLRIDRSVVSSLAGGVQTQLISALKYLGLIDEESRPTELLTDLVKAESGDRRRFFLRIIEQQYLFVNAEKLDLQRATRKQLEAMFIEEGVVGARLQKAIAFFLSVSRIAGLPVSPHISMAQESIRASRRRSPQIGSQRIRGEALLLLAEKLPALPPFDVNWSEDLKARWLTSFDGLVHVMRNGSFASLSPMIAMDVSESASPDNPSE